MPSSPFFLDRTAPTRVPTTARRNTLQDLPPEKQKELKKLETACNDFESIFVYQLLKEMRKTVNKTGMVHGGRAEEIFSDMLDQERAKGVPIGIGSILFQDLSRAIVPPARPR
jgi:Rod binding domain-containing protein